MKAYSYIYDLYEAAVQNVDADINTALRIFNKHNISKPTLIREDFCGTAKLAIEWVKRNTNNYAWGIDLEQSALDWTTQNHVSDLNKEQQKRINLIRCDVIDCSISPVDIILALNFSFCVFKKRLMLKKYFQNVRKGLKKNGVFILDIYGGTESIISKEDEVRDIQSFTTKAGNFIPKFKYIWEQFTYNPITHHTTCYIHFDIPGLRKIRKAFTYEWRLWTLPEIQELMKEAGFKKTEVYIHGFDESGDSDDIFRLRRKYENTEGWVAYVAGINL